MYAIYGNIYHQYTPNFGIYTSTMDPMGYLLGQKKHVVSHQVTVRVHDECIGSDVFGLLAGSSWG